MKVVRLLFFLLVFAPSSGVARADNNAEAKQHYQRGVTAYNLQRFEVALKEFQAAYESRPDAAFLFNIAQTQRQLGQYDAAIKSYRAYLREQPDAPNRGEVLKRIGDMENAAAERRATAPPEGVISPAAKPLTPVATTPADINVRTNAPAPATKSIALRNAGIGLGAGGVALLALGGVFAGLAKSAGDSAYHGSAYDYGADNRYHGYQSAEIASFVVGGAALATGVVLIAIGTRGAHR
jgi:tetratricopeptide (TPR) repeat protein